MGDLFTGKEMVKDELHSELKKGIRDSANSVATTGLHHSISSSGRMKMIDEDQLVNSKHIITSFGSGKSQKDEKNSKRFLVKVSKIIEENNLEDAGETMKNGREKLSDSDLENCLESLLRSDGPMKEAGEIEQELVTLEQEMNYLL